MTRKATHRIRKLRIGEVSFVDEGDNPGADVVIMKRRTVDAQVLKSRLDEAMAAAGDLAELAAGTGGEEGVEKAAQILGDMDMTIEELQSKLDQIDTDLQAVTKRADDAEAEVEVLKGKLATAETERDAAVEKVKAAPADEDKTDEDVLKGLPEPIRKRLEDAEKVARDAATEVEKARDERDLSANVEKVKALGVADADGLGALLHRIAKGKTVAADADKVIEVLQIAKGVAEEGKVLFTAIGKANGNDAAATEAEDAQGQLDEAIAKVRAAEPSLTAEQAYAKALDANPALYDKIAKHKPTVTA